MPARQHSPSTAPQAQPGTAASTAASVAPTVAAAAVPARRSHAAAQRLARRRRAMQRRHPRLSRLLCWLLAAVLGSAGVAYAQVPAHALPSGGRVVVGAGQLQHGNNLLIVNQSTQRLGMDWQSFNIGSGATVEFRQPGASSVALNRIVGHSGTEIYGQLRANGQVFLSNPNGVLFAPGSKVDVGGLVASTLDLSQEDFAAGRYIFSGAPQPGARVLNQGSLRASAGGYLALFGQQVENQGDISVNAGAVVLASGRAATVSISGSGLISAVVNPGEAGSVANSGSIAADGGTVTLNAHSAQAIAESLVNNSGIVRANTLVERGGEIWITGDRVSSSGTLRADASGTADAGRISVKGGMERGSLEAGGTISARAEHGAGGQVETSAAQVRIATDMRVTTLSQAGSHGTWLIDPTDFTVAAGAAALTTSGIGADTLAINLNAGNVSLATATAGSEPGDLRVNAPVSWSASTRLTLSANRNVDINANLTAAGDAAELFVIPGTGGSFNMATGARVSLPGSKSQFDVGAVRYTMVRTLADLQALDGTATLLAGNYALANDIDASSTATGAGFNPIGNETTTAVSTTNSFGGRFQGLGNSITSLNINRPTSNATGLFASTNGANIQNLVISGGSVAGSQAVGALVGTLGGATTITNVRSSAAVSGVDDSSSGVLVGGLIGDTGTTAGTVISRSAAFGAVSADTNTATAHVGGLIGELAGGTLSNVSASGNVSATLRTGTGASSHYVGGLVGVANGTAIGIDNASASGNVSGRREVGGLIGRFAPGTGGGTLSNSTATGNVNSFGDAGGLVGAATGTGSISSSSASGTVASSDATTLSAGGAVGWYNLNLAPTALSASGSVSGAGQSGGVIGYYQSNGVLTGASLADTVISGVTKTVSGNTWVGGLIGYSSSTDSISGLTASAHVTATASNGVAGGLIGRTAGAVSSSSASGNVVGVTDVGGLVGRAEGAGGFTDVAATGTASGSGTGARTGGLVGFYNNSGNLLRGSASGAVSSANIGGGLVGSYSSAGSLQNGSTAATSTVNAGGYAGGLVGDAAGTGTAAITDSTARGSVTSTSSSAYVGGLVGDFTMAGGMARVTATGNVSGGARTGGLAGNYGASGAITTASSTAASVSGTTYVGGLVGYHNGGAVSSASAVAAVTATNTTGASYAGGLIGRSGGAVSNATASGAVASNTLSSAFVGGLIGSAEGTGAVTDGTASGAVSSASTTSSSVGGLVGDSTSGSIIRGTATGNVSGGLYTGGLVGQFTNSSGATIQNADARGTVSGRGDAGGIVGYASGNGSMSASTAIGSVSSSATSSYSVGGAAGYFALSGGMTGIAATGNVTGAANAGGVAGYYNTTAALTGVTSTAGTVQGTTFAGGIVGYSNAASITGLTSAAAVTTTGTGGFAGGLAGRTGGAVSASTATGNVTAADGAGGLIGQAAGTGAMSDLQASGNVTSSGTSAFVGGLVGQLSSGALDDGRASGAVSGGAYTGGLVGYFNASGNLSNSQASGNVTGSSSSSTVGGLVGYAAGSGLFDNVTASGRVTAPSTGTYTGGLVGQFSKPGGMNKATATGAVSGGSRVGGLVGYYVSGGNLSDSSAGGAVTGGSYAGGLVGDFYASGNLTNSSATGAVSGGDYVGGLVGSFYSAGNASTLLASGNVTGTGAYTGGLFGAWQYSGTLVDSRATGNVLGANRAGGLIGYGYNNGGINNSSAAGSAFGGAYAGGLAGQLDYTNVTLATATGNVAVLGDGTAFAGGLIGQYSNFNTGASLNSSTATGSVTSDSPSGYTGGLVGYFSGGLLTTSSASGRVMAIDTTTSSSSSHYTGGLVGLFSGASISDSSASGAVVGRYMAGGLVGYYSANSPMSNVSATGSAEAQQFAGGLVGYLESGGLVTGTASGNVRIVNASGGDSTSGGYAGGLIGYATLYNTSGTASGQGSINDARASGSVSAADYAGGLIGYLYDYNSVATVGTVSNSSASGSVNGRNFVGGLIGSWDWVGGTTTNRASRGLRNSSASGSVSGISNVGGLVGYFSSHGGIQDSFATGNVTARGSTSTFQLGGLAGYYRNLHTGVDQGQLLRSYASGNVTLSPGTALASFTDAYGGGLVGYLDGAAATSTTLADSYASGAVSMISPLGRLRAGGLLGFTDTSIARAYATGAVTATLTSTGSAAGGLVAQRSSTSATATSSYWATDTSGRTSSAMGTASTLGEMKSAATFTGWDIANSGGTTQVWRIYEGQATPLLRGLLTPITLTLGDITKVYDGTTSLGSATISVGGIAVTNPGGIFVSGISANAGTYALTASNLYSLAGGYDLSLSGSASLTIDRRLITLDGLVRDKVYDGTTTATLAATPTFGGLVAGEDLRLLTGSGFGVSFATKTAGVDKTVNISGSYAIGDGTVGKASNYVAPTTITTTADITRAVLTAGSFSATNRVYDGTTTVAVSAAASTLGGVISGDSVSVDLASVTSGRVADKNVGSAKPVTVLGASITGADAANYTLAGIDGVSVDITPKALTVNGITASDRVYYPSTDVSLGTSSIALSGLVSGDQVQARTSGLRGNMADKHVGSSKPVTVTGLGLRGLDAGNYTATAGPVAVNITPYLLTLYLGTTSTTNRVYDGTTNASVSFPTYWYGGDDITVGTTSIGFADKNVAYTSGGAVTGKDITASGLSISGADAGNYALQNATATLRATITPKPLAVSGVSAVNRVYDGTRDVTVNISGATVDTTAVISGDDVGVATPGSGSVTGQMANKNVGSAKPVTVPGLALTGADAGNYTITSSSGGGVTVNIARKDLTAVYTAVNKVYDGDFYSPMTVTSADIVSGDSVNFYIDRSYCGDNACGYALFTESGRGAGGSYTTSRHVGTAKPVVIIYNQLVGTDEGNYNLLNPTGSASANITPKPVTLAFNGTSKVYDGSTNATVALNFGASGLFSGDTLTSTQTAIYTGTGAKNVGTGKPISISDISLSGTHAGNYTVGVTTATSSGTVTAKPVTVSGITATDRAYDGTTSVAVTAGTVGSSGFVAGDVVAIALPPTGLSTGTIASKNVGVDKPVTVTGLTLTGSDAANYSIDATGSGITVDITPAALTPSYTGGSRVYNGGVAATVTPATTGIFAGDIVTFSQSAVFTGAEARDAGTGKPISITGIGISGSGAVNYSLASTTASTTGSITPKPVSPTYTGASRVYNGVSDVSAAVVGTSLQFVAGDSVGLSETARFTGDGSAGIGKAVSVTSISLTGRHATNYSLSSTSATTTATITPRPLGVTGISATHRVYDGTTSVSVNVAGATVDTSTVIAGDDVSVTLPSSGISSGDMADRHAGNNKPVAITGLAISGTSAANYALIGASGLTVNIAPRSLTASYVGVSKVYDGNAEAAVTATSGDILAIDSSVLGFSATGLFTGGKNVGTAKAIDVSGAFLTGAARDNYSLGNPGGTASADITPRVLSANYSGGTKVYDGTTSAVVTGTLFNRVAGDAVSATQTAEFTGTGARNVGSGKAISVTGITLTGADKDNYTLPVTTDTTTGSITPKPITVSGLTSVLATDRIYDGTRLVEVTVPSGVTLVPSSSDIIAGDTVTIAVPVSGVTSGTVASKNVGSGKPVTVDGLTLSGTDKDNYSIAGTAGITVSITPKSLTASYAGVNKVYDGSTAATASGSSGDIVAGDGVLVRGTGVFTGSGAKNVGSGKAVDITGATLAGTDGGNYTLLNPTGTTSADITTRTITPVYAGGSRVYDGSTAAPVSASVSGFVAGDSVSLSQSAFFTGTGARNVGAGKAITVSGITLSGADATNYSLSTTAASTTGTITPKPLSLTGLTGVSAADRVYDGTRTVAVTVTSTGTIGIDPADIVSGDDVSVTPPTSGLTTGTMLTKNAGSNKPLVVDGLALSGSDAGNYIVAAASGITVNIARRDLSASFTGVDKVYDGTAAATVLGTSAGIVAGDSLGIAGTGVFSAGKNAGTGLTINVTGGSLSGIDAVNYNLLASTGTATASIVPKVISAAYVGGTRVYDGTTLAPVSGTLAGLIAGDAVTLGQSASFSGSGAKNVGVGKAVSVTGIALAGSDAGNYSLSGATAFTTATVIPRPLGIIGLSGVSAADREYDGTRNVAVTVLTTGTVSPDSRDLIAGDDVTITAPPTGASTGTMADKHVGSNKPVAVAGLTLGGADAANYSVASTSGVTVNITPRTLSPTYTGISRVYDGTVTATAAGTAGGIVAGDSLLIVGTGIYTGSGARNVGTAKAVAISGATMTGLDAGNYLLSTTTASTTADITPRALANSYLGGTRVYDGTTAAPVTRTTTGLIDGDAVTVSESATFQGGGARNAGPAKPVLVSGITLAGSDAANYALTATSALTTGSITPRPLNVTGLAGITASNRAYDGTTAVAVDLSGVSGTASIDIISGDDVTLGAPGSGLGGGTMADKHVGTAKPVRLTGLTLSGADAGNYEIRGVAGVTVNITPLTVTLSGVSAVDRVYDGTTAVAIDTSGGLITGKLTGDDLSLLSSGSTGSMADKHVGSGKAVSFAGLTLGGSDARNYVVAGGSGLTVNITPRTLTPGVTVADRVYNGSTNATVTLSNDGIASDVLTLSGIATYADRNAGSGIAVTVAGLALAGADARNYVLGASSLASTGTITRAPLAITGRSLEKIYGETHAFGSADFDSSGLVAGETMGSVALASAGAAAGASASASPYALNVSSATGGSFNPANYDISYIDGQLLVKPRPLTITTHSVVRYVGDATDLSGVGFSLGGRGLAGSDSIRSVVTPVPPGSDSAQGSATFVLRPSSAVFGSGDAANYALSYGSSLLVVQPRPPQATEVEAGATGGSDFGLLLTEAERQALESELQRASASANPLSTAATTTQPQAARARTVVGTLTAGEIAELLSGDGRQLTLQALSKMPLIAIDPQLRRLMGGAATAP